jgi:hypothetical protein
MSDFLGMQRAVLRSTRSTTEKMVLLAIIDHWSEASPEPWPSVPTLATLSSLGRTAVLDALAAMERHGVIGVRRVAGRPNRYDLSRVAVALTARAEPVRQAGESRSPLGRDTRGERETKPAEPVRDADRSGPRTSPSAGRDQSAWRTRRIPRSNQRRKPLPCARTRPTCPQPRSRCQSPNAPSSCSEAREKPSGCDRSNGQKHRKSGKPTVVPLAACARCRNGA